MLDGGGALIAKAGNTVALGPGAALNLRDLDNLRVLATKKGLILRAGDNGRRSLKLLYKAGAKSAKAGAIVGKGAQAKALTASAKSVAVSANTLAKSAKSIAVPVKAVAAGGGATKVALGTLATLSALGTLGPVLLLGGMAAATATAYFLVRGREPLAEPEY